MCNAYFHSNNSFIFKYLVLVMLQYCVAFKKYIILSLYKGHYNDIDLLRISEATFAKVNGLLFIYRIPGVLCDWPVT